MGIVTSNESGRFCSSEGSLIIVLSFPNAVELVAPSNQQIEPFVQRICQSREKLPLRTCVSQGEPDRFF